MKNMKKVLAILLALVMVIAAVGCKKNEPDAGKTPDSGNALDQLQNAKDEADTKKEEQQPVKQDEPVVTDAPVEEKATYTFNDALTTFPTLWNPHTYETSTDAEITDYITAGFYTFDYNDTYDGYQLVPYMATEKPIDVTSQYIGQYGLEEGAKNKAYVIKLRDDLKWEDGTKITANDFVESGKRLENPEAQNYRADNLYSGNLVIYNAKNYLYQGKHAYSTPLISTNYGDDEYVLFEDLIPVDNVLTLDGVNKDLVISVNDGSSWGSDSLSAYAGAGYFGAAGDALYDQFIAFTDTADENGFVKVTVDAYQMLCDIVAILHGYENAEGYAADAGEYAYKEWEELCYVGEDYAAMDWSEVGMFALSDTELVLILEKELTGFYLLYALSDSWLVKNDLYDSCISYVDGVYTNTYGTSVETTASYGPYKLSAFQADKQYTLDKNENFFGLNIPNENTIYQTTSIVVNFVPEPSTRLELFNQGQLDGYGLSKDDMETYSRSDYCYYTPGDSVYAMAFNPDFDALVNMQAAAGANINKTIITLPEFRMAMSFAMNRADFCLATSPTNNAAFALYSTLIISDPENGVAYRTTDPAKQVIANFWGLQGEYGEGKLYANIDEAIESVTGYNLTKAKEFFNTAYDKAIELGYMDADDVVEIKVGTPNNTSTFYNNGYEYIVNNYTEAVKGTKLEGKLTFSRDDTLGNGFSSALKSNQVDMLFGVGWTGSALDPYNLMEAYTSTSYQYDPAWDTTTSPMTITINGVEYTASVWTWNEIMMGESRTITAADGTTTEYSCGDADGDAATRLEILAAIENAVLMQYDFIPLMDASTADLKGMKIKYFTEDYIFGLGRGGIKYYTYNYTDKEWADFVASQNGVLDYK